MDLTASAGLPASGSGLPANIIADDAWTNTTTAAVSVVYSIVPVGTNGCPGDTRTMTITVNPEPVLASLDATKCSDEVLGFNLAVATGSVAAATYNITAINANGLTASAGAPATGNGLAATVISNDSWTNTTSAPVNVVYTVVPVSASGCLGDPKTVTITVNPEPVLANLDATKCSDEVLGFNLAVATGSVAATTYNITSINSNGLTASAGLPSSGSGLPANVIADDAWTNTNAVPVNVIYTVVPVSTSGCLGNSKTITISVNPEPVMATPGATKCSREALGFNLSVNAGGVTASTYNITSINANGLTASAGLPSSGSGLPSNIIADDAWINTTSANVNVVYTVVPVSAAGCQGNPATITIVIKPEPVITAGQSTSACSGNALNYAIGLDNFTNPVAGVTFTWDAPDLDPVSPSFTGGSARITASSANITDTFINTLGLIGKATYTVTPYKDGCAGFPVDIVINVGSQPVLDPGLNKTICSNAVTGLILKEAAGSVAPTYYNVSITMEADLVAAGGNHILPDVMAPATALANDRFANMTGVNKTVTYHVQPILAPDCIGDAIDVVITVRPQPVIQPGQTDTYCSGVAINKEIRLIPVNTPAGTLFNWDAPDISDSSVQGTAGVNVAADPGGTIHIKDAINNYSSAPITATYTITPTSQYGCAGDPVPVVITINQEPVPLPISGRLNLCAGDNPVVYSVTPVAGSSFHWTVNPAVGTKTFDFNTNAIMITAASAAGSGNISVYETNALGCSGDPTTITVNVLTSASPEDITGDTPVCALSTHTYNVTNRAGSVYNWTIPGGAYIIGNSSASSVSVTFSNVGGSILVRETNVAGCVTNHNPFAVTVNPLPTAFISNGGTMCDGGTRPLNVAFNGTAPFNFTYAINGVSQAPVSTSSNPYTINAILAGTYTIVNVTDNTGCTNNGSGSAVITYFPKPTGIISGGGELCRGSSATLTMTFTGVAPFTFTYSDGINPAVTVTNHPTNVYTVSVSPLVTSTYTLTSLTDFNNCVGILSGSALINVNQPPSLSLSGTNLKCYNIPTGAVDMTISGGTAPFGMAWTGPNGFTSPTEDISGLAEGYYAVSVTDSKGCRANANITLSQPTALSVTTTRVNVLCFGSSTGSATATVSGGTGPYSYLWNSVPVQTTATATSLPAGTYTVTVTDANSCSITASATVTEPSTALTVITTRVNVLCHGGSTGSATAIPTGGTGPYSYSWNSAPAQTTATASNLSAATYTVTVTDANGCFGTAVVTITEPADGLTVSATQVNVLCYGNTTGSATAVPAGGTAPYTYTWNTVPAQTAVTAFNLSIGTYTVTVRDANNCTATASVTITQPAAPLTVTTTQTNVAAYGGSTGTATANPSGGAGGYTYSWNTVPVQTTATAVNLSAGTYVVTVTDANGCSTTASVTITQPSAALTITTSQVNVLCYGDATGSASAAASGGVGPYLYSWNTTPVQTTASVVNLTAGPYIVTVTDANSNSAAATVNIAQPLANLSTTTSQINVLCSGNSTGSATVFPAGGTMPYSYSWNTVPAQTTATAINLPANTYQVTVTDAHGCITTASVTIAQPSVSLTLSTTKNDVLCSGNSTGSASTVPSGGTGPYTYSWNTFPVQTAATAVNLQAGTYTVTVRDVNNCTATDVITIAQPAPLIVSTSQINVLCFGSSTGNATATVSGGIGPYNYSWNSVPVQATATATSLPAGTYTVTVTDANSCSKTAMVTITQPSSPLTVNTARVNVLCSGNSTGTATALPSGGTAPYTYSWNSTPVQTTATAVNLPANTYTVTVRDANNCSTAATVVITQPSALTLSMAHTNVLCNGTSTGTATAAAGGGTGTYFYYWYSDASLSTSIGQFTSTAINLPVGTYYVKVTDLNGCEITGSAVITEPVALDASITLQTNVACFGNSNGSVTVGAAAGTGTAPYTYSIDGGNTWSGTGTFNSLSAMPYNVFVRDANNCIKVVPVTISQPLQLTATITAQTNVSCFGLSDGSVTVTPAAGSGTSPYTYSRDGSTWVSSGTFSGLTAGSYNIRVRDLHNCTVNIPVVITEPSVLELNPTATVALNCYGDRDGIWVFYATGGTPGYTFTEAYNDASATLAGSGYNSQTIMNAGAGIVTVRVTDSKGCTDEASVTFTQPAILTPGSITADQNICNGQDPDIIEEDVAPAGGPDPGYRYQWQYSNSSTGTFINIQGANNNEYDPPADAKYTLYYRRMVTSGFCEPVYSNIIEVVVNPLPIARLTGGGSVCPGESSVLTVEMLAGTGPFEIDIIDDKGIITSYTSTDVIEVTPLVTTTYTLHRVEDANGCEVTGQPNLFGEAEIIVKDLPSVTNPDDKVVCEFGVTAFNVTGTGVDLYQWYVDDGTTVSALEDEDVYFGAHSATLNIFGATREMNGYVYHVVVSGCSPDAFSSGATLTVNTVPEIIRQPKDTVICSGHNAAFHVSAKGTGLTFKWKVRKTTGGFVDVETNLTNYTGASDSVLVLTNVPENFNNYLFQVTVDGDCGAAIRSNVVALRVSKPAVVTSQPENKSVCDGAGSVWFRSGGSGMIDSLRWQVLLPLATDWIDINDDGIYSGATTQQLSLIDAPSSYSGNRYRLALKASCENSYSNPATLIVNSNPVVTFSPDPIPVCGNEEKIIIPTITGGTEPWKHHNWTGDIGALDSYLIQNPTFRSFMSGTYNLNYRVEDNNGCYGSASVSVEVDSPDATFDLDDASMCTPGTVQFTKDDWTGIDSWTWDFDDGTTNTTESNPVHTFTNANATAIEFYNVKLTVESAVGCKASYTRFVTVYPAIDATIAADKLIVCSGDAITFSAKPGAATYFWDYGDLASGSGTDLSEHLYINETIDGSPVVRTVTLTTTSIYNCIDVKTIDITVLPAPIPQFTAIPLTQVFNAAGNPVTFTNTTNAGTWNWLWRFGDSTTSTEKDPVHTYTNVGTYSVTLIASNANCSDSVKHNINVVPPAPFADFDSIPSGCSPLYVNINNTSLHTDVPGTTYHWDFGDGSTSTAKNPTYTYFTAGIYRIELVVTGPGGTSMKSQVVNAYASPKAYFEVTPPTVYVNDERVRCFNLTEEVGVTTYLWDFGDGDTSKVKEPYHRYMEEGIYDITLWAYSENGCTDMYILSPAVTVEPVGELRFSTVFIPNKTGPIERTDLPNGGYEADQFFYPPIRQKVLKYKLQIFNRLGVLIFQSDDINVPWNGYYKGNLCQQGVYVWYVEGKYADGKPYKMVGNVTLLQ